MFLQEWQKRRRKEEYICKQEAQDRTNALHRKIDEWRTQIVAADEAKRKVLSIPTKFFFLKIAVNLFYVLVDIFFSGFVYRQIQ